MRTYCKKILTKGYNPKPDNIDSIVKPKPTPSPQPRKAKIMGKSDRRIELAVEMLANDFSELSDETQAVCSILFELIESLEARVLDLERQKV